jgi:hypothetical protein
MIFRNGEKDEAKNESKTLPIKSRRMNESIVQYQQNDPSSLACAVWRVPYLLAYQVPVFSEPSRHQVGYRYQK